LAPGGPDWTGEASFAWHDVLHAGAAVRRGRLWQGLWYLTRVRDRALSLAQQRHGYDADSCDYVDALPDEELAAFPSTVVACVEPAALLEALEAATRCLITELRRGDPELADRLGDPLLKFVAVAWDVDHGPGSYWVMARGSEGSPTSAPTA
jgi:alkylation response protein AidB-like acyl-CoA dehydrogenase